jgi:hypothetical protein
MCSETAALVEWITMQSELLCLVPGDTVTDTVGGISRLEESLRIIDSASTP